MLKSGIFLDAVPTQFTMYLNGNPVQTITNITALTKLSTSTTVGYILPYLSSNIGSVNKNLNFSPLASDKLKMIIIAFNVLKSLLFFGC